MFRLKFFAPRCHGIFQSLPHMWKGQASVRPVSSGQPDWWKLGWPRERVDSMAEAELLSQLALLLRPRVPIAEMFRRFPAPEGWGGHYLDPDLAVYGVLRKKDAALFVEYDGYWRHGEEESMLRDQRKSATLLANAPPGSWVVRLSQTTRSKDGNVVWISVSKWRQGDQNSLGKVLQGVLHVLLGEFEGRFRPEVENRLRIKAGMDSIRMPAAARKFCDLASALRGASTQEEINNYLSSNGFCTTSIEKLEQKLVAFSCSIERHLEPSMSQLCEIGLAKSQVAKAISRCKSPRNLSGSIDQKLKPTVHWLLELGLDKAQIARLVSSFPHVFGYKIENNLKPTVRWLLKLGFSKLQVGKLVSVFPQVLGCSIENNLEPKVQWLWELGLSKSEVASTLAIKPQILGYSLERNMKPKVRWLRDLGLNSDQIVRVITLRPLILGLSAANLKSKVQLLNDVLPKHQVSDLIARSPWILAERVESFHRRVDVLAMQQKNIAVKKGRALLESNHQ